MQAIILVFFGDSILSAWGAIAGSELRIDATAFLRVKSLGAPVTVLLLVTQVETYLFWQTAVGMTLGVSISAMHIIADTDF